MSLLSPDRLMDIFQDCRQSQFRVEFRDHYSVATDGDDYQRWLDGAAAPNPVRKARVMADILDERARGIRLSRVKVMSKARTAYERYACAWGYDYNQVPVDGHILGERIYIWDLADHPLPGQAQGLQDFWLIDDQTVVLMHYNDEGQFLGGELAARGQLMVYLHAREALLHGAVLFPLWWAGHSELHRTRQVAA